MEFEWDERKNRINLEKHGLDFEDAIAIWDGVIVRAPSSQSCHGEERFLAYGMVERRVICVVFTHRGKNLRIISARSVRSHERDNYYEAVGRGTPG